MSRVMPRREFSKSVRVEIVKRATVNGQTYCEECHALAKTFEIHHIRPDGLEIEKQAKLTAKEGALLCRPCHAEHTKKDVPTIARAVRLEAKHIGAVRPAGNIKSPGFVRAAKAPRESRHHAQGASNLARRFTQVRQ
jgi:hypothetical protein